MTTVCVKPRFVQITDADEASALRALPKYQEGLPHWVFRGGQVWAHIDEHFQNWRAARAAIEQCSKACTAPTEGDCIRDGRSCLENTSTGEDK
jgi:hypothetical protein